MGSSAPNINAAGGPAGCTAGSGLLANGAGKAGESQTACDAEERSKSPVVEGTTIATVPTLAVQISPSGTGSGSIINSTTSSK